MWKNSSQYFSNFARLCNYVAKLELYSKSSNWSYVLQYHTTQMTEVERQYI
jgi:hypothetical protein